MHTECQGEATKQAVKQFQRRTEHAENKVRTTVKQMKTQSQFCSTELQFDYIPIPSSCNSDIPSSVIVERYSRILQLVHCKLNLLGKFNV